MTKLVELVVNLESVVIKLSEKEAKEVLEGNHKLLNDLVMKKLTKKIKEQGSISESIEEL